MSRSVCCPRRLRRQSLQRARRPRHRRRAAARSEPGAVATGSSLVQDAPNRDLAHWRSCVTRIERAAVANSWLEPILIEYSKLSLTLLTGVCWVAKLKVKSI